MTSKINTVYIGYDIKQENTSIGSEQSVPYIYMSSLIIIIIRSSFLFMV